MSDDLSSVIETLLYGNQLKRTARTGWAQRGIPDAEDVAAHSFGVAFIAMVLAEATVEDPDLGRVLAMALLHDLPESITTDIPTPSWRYLPQGSKLIMENAAMEKIFAQTGYAEPFLGLWRELQTSETIEARIVGDADKLDMYLQALMYEKQTGNQQLAEFWMTRPEFALPISASIYEELLSRRSSN